MKTTLTILIILFTSVVYPVWRGVQISLLSRDTHSSRDFLYRIVCGWVLTFLCKIPRCVS